MHEEPRFMKELPLTSKCSVCNVTYCDVIQGRSEYLIPWGLYLLCDRCHRQAVMEALHTEVKPLFERPRWSSYARQVTLFEVTEMPRCKIFEGCWFYGRKIEPTSTEFDMIQKYCNGNYMGCARYQFAQYYGFCYLPRGLQPNEIGKVKGVLRSIISWDIRITSSPFWLPKSYSHLFIKAISPAHWLLADRTGCLKKGFVGRGPHLVSMQAPP